MCEVTDDVQMLVYQPQGINVKLIGDLLILQFEFIKHLTQHNYV